MRADALAVKLHDAVPRVVVAAQPVPAIALFGSVDLCPEIVFVLRGELYYVAARGALLFSVA
jgi:hypothetical protein